MRHEFDSNKQEVFSHKININKDKFRISRSEFNRVFFGLVVFTIPAFFAFYFQQFAMMAFAIMFGVLVFLWQLLYCGYAPKSKSKGDLNVTNFYSKGTLIFFAFFWGALILGVSIALYLKLPNSQTPKLPNVQ